MLLAGRMDVKLFAFLELGSGETLELKNHTYNYYFDLICGTQQITLYFDIPTKNLDVTNTPTAKAENVI